VANGIVTRQSVEGVQADPAAVAALRDAYGRMQAFSETDNRSWIYWAGFHGFPQWFCWHHGRAGLRSQRSFNLFLPWHRAYLLYFEFAARDLNDGAVIPWWDWTSVESHTVGVPQAFTVPVIGGVQNPMSSGPMSYPTNEWYAESTGEFAQTSATTAADTASNPPTDSDRRMPARNVVSPGAGSGRMRRTTDTWGPHP